MLGILEKVSPSKLVSNSYISNHNKARRPCPKFKVSFYLYFCCFWINVTQINFENITQKYKESFLIVVSSWICDLMLMLERPLSHYWTSPLNMYNLHCCNGFHVKSWNGQVWLQDRKFLLSFQNMFLYPLPDNIRNSFFMWITMECL